MQQAPRSVQQDRSQNKALSYVFKKKASGKAGVQNTSKISPSLKH